MSRIPLLDYQLKAIKNRLNASYDEIEELILDKYEVSCLEDLYATDYDEIMEDIHQCHKEITEEHV